MQTNVIQVAEPSDLLVSESISINELSDDELQDLIIDRETQQFNINDDVDVQADTSIEDILVPVCTSVTSSTIQERPYQLRVINNVIKP